VSKSSPLVCATLPVKDVKDLSTRDDVATVYLNEGIDTPALEVAKVADEVWRVWAAGITGAGQTVGDLEPGDAATLTGPQPYDNWYLPRLTHMGSYPNNYYAHATAVSGIIASTHVRRTGMSYNAAIYGDGSNKGDRTEIAAGAQNLAGNYVDTVNYSGGSNQGGVLGLSILDRVMDDIVRVYADNMICAGGNEGNDGYIISPAQAYNVVAVGAFDDHNTGSFADDTMATFSSGVDPISAHSDREKPEVAAPGVNINSLTNSLLGNGDVGSGTSYAAPMVSGICALLGEKTPALNGWPEAVKAIVMATAWRNIEGASRLSELDGAGAVDAFKAMVTSNYNWPLGYKTPTNNNRGWGASSITPAWFDETGTLNTLAEVYLVAGKRFRACFSWDTNTSYANYTTQPSADLDLWLVNSSNIVVTSSSSWDNTYEIVDFTVPATGYYKLKAYNFRFDEAMTYAGWAWYSL
ncbi:MAG: S8 family serine peptidase, partial [Dehalococcoidales bacterium]|nr:S8 family serine peptidase [Dehalococcoidales bacterium]